jgi:hypothetical protein
MHRQLSRSTLSLSVSSRGNIVRNLGAVQGVIMGYHTVTDDPAYAC